MLSRPLEDGDQEEGSDEALGVIDTCMSYTATVSVQGVEQDIAMQDEVHLSSSSWLVSGLMVFVD